MSVPDRLLWGSVPREEQQASLRRKVARVILNKRPPLPPAYARELIDEVMAEIESWDWWQKRWYGEWDR